MALGLKDSLAKRRGGGPRLPVPAGAVRSKEGSMAEAKTMVGFQSLEKSRAEWKKLLPADRYAILFKGSTERSLSSPLNGEMRAGTFICAACFLPLFSSEAKFESGTGWPSFFQALPGCVATKRDFKLLWP